MTGDRLHAGVEEIESIEEKEPLIEENEPLIEEIEST